MGKSAGIKGSLGWISINTGAEKRKNGAIFFNGQHINVWDSYWLSQYKFRSASFCDDSRGRWYFNVVVDLEAEQSKGTGRVGIDLGCKETATDSTGHKIKGREYRKLESKLGIAQRAKNKKRVKKIHAKIKNRREPSVSACTNTATN